MGTPRLVRTGNQNIINHGNRGRRVRVKTGRSRNRELLLQTNHLFKLHVRNAAALDGVARCTCKAAAVFDSAIQCKPHGLRPPRSLVIEHVHRPKCPWDWTMEQFTLWKFFGTRFDHTLTGTEMLGIVNPRGRHNENLKALTSNLDACTGLPRGPCTNL
jgi:hypothetical protein